MLRSGMQRDESMQVHFVGLDQLQKNQSLKTPIQAQNSVRCDEEDFYSFSHALSMSPFAIPLHKYRVVNLKFESKKSTTDANTTTFFLIQNLHDYI
ncbi:uncharacterized protein LOC141723498 isoform X2 [Apium graveolens]|uniref:uncharacterized protein LOC141723498 isoform X2 n=1 Tax=Apium graveolens TaxID=4045 RepID=UPI003D799938